ncbi:hypothetical protein NDU88_004772 [Pleurodeles waltl]|uniref:Uncharacterized protein n=1 Tax=Pleurodeles waltl TaxID=8319 RepID=A0AAV7KYR9_PLEWA|nr:hypothetical protein NDU88_004772 [Pleurodeles waltl]
MRRARARVLNGRRRPLRDAVSEGQKKGRAFPYNNRALNTQVSQCNSNNSDRNQGLEARMVCDADVARVKPIPRFWSDDETPRSERLLSNR